jgi:hypothetical protein
MKLEEITKELLFKPNTVFCPKDLVTAIELLRLADSYGAMTHNQYPIFRKTKSINSLYNKTYRSIFTIVNIYYEYYELQKTGNQQFHSYIKSWKKHLKELLIHNNEIICRQFGPSSTWAPKHYYENQEYTKYDIIVVEHDTLTMDFDIPNKDSWFFATDGLFEKIKEVYPKYEKDILDFLNNNDY